MSSNESFTPLPAITSSAVISPIDTSTYFREDYSEPNYSPIDQYIENTKALNRIALSGTFSREMGAIVILGHMSAVESYLRAVLRGVITIDEVSQKLVEKSMVPYAAALHHDIRLLPEALFEGISLASTKNIKDTLKGMIGIKGSYPPDVTKVLDEFSKVCEIRHCCVHRFGKLGAKNAADLGLSDHSLYLEKPLDIQQADLEDILYILRAVVNTLNRFMYESLLARMAKNKNDLGQQPYPNSWTWDYNKDRRRFLKYYNLFYTIEDSSPSPAAKSIYDIYRGNYKR